MEDSHLTGRLPHNGPKMDDAQHPQYRIISLNRNSAARTAKIPIVRGHLPTWPEVAFSKRCIWSQYIAGSKLLFAFRVRRPELSSVKPWKLSCQRMSPGHEQKRRRDFMSFGGGWSELCIIVGIGIFYLLGLFRGIGILVRACRATFSRLGDWVQTIWLFALLRLTRDFWFCLIFAGWATFSRSGDGVWTAKLRRLFASLRFTLNFFVTTGAFCAVILFKFFTLLVHPVVFLPQTFSFVRAWRATFSQLDDCVQTLEFFKNLRTIFLYTSFLFCLWLFFADWGKPLRLIITVELARFCNTTDFLLSTCAICAVILWKSTIGLQKRLLSVPITLRRFLAVCNAWRLFWFALCNAWCVFWFATFCPRWDPDSFWVKNQQNLVIEPQISTGSMCFNSTVFDAPSRVTLIFARIVRISAPFLARHPFNINSSEDHRKTNYEDIRLDFHLFWTGPEASWICRCSGNWGEQYQKWPHYLKNYF